MAVRLVNRSKADCDINLHDGRTVRIKPSSYIKIGDTISDRAKSYYRQLNDLGLFVVEEPVVQSEEPVVQSDVESVVEDKVEMEEILTMDELMKHRHAELVEIATSYGIDELEGLSKKQISEKIIEVVNG